MTLEILPDFLYSIPEIEVLLKSRNSAVVHKTLSTSLVDKRMYLSSVAILLVEKGMQVIQNCDNSPITVNEKELVVLPKDLYVVSDFIADKGLFKAVVFFADDDLIKKFLAFYRGSSGGSKSIGGITKIKSNTQISSYIDSLCSMYKGHESSRAQVEVKIIEFLLLLSSDSDNDTFVYTLIEPVRKRGVRKFMEENYLENLKIEDYAALTGRSVSTFNREFKRLFETTPNKWLIEKRLERSRELLGSTNMSVTNVSIEVGYENISHFINAYKKRYGVTPRHDKAKVSD